jgi:hypothetical protein
LQLASDAAELTSAATDLILAGMAAVGAFAARRWLWRVFFGGLALVSALGAAVHGLVLAPATDDALWLCLNLVLGATVACFALAVLAEARGAAFARIFAAPLLVLGVSVGAAAQFFPNTFLPFVIFNTAVLLVTGWSGLRRGHWPLWSGCLVALLAGGVQASGWRVHFGWEFDSNGLFHLVQIPALLLWIRAARTLPEA